MIVLRIGFQPGKLPQLGDDRSQGLALDVLHCVIMDTAIAADSMDRNEVGVVEVGRSLGLVLEALQLPAVYGRCERQDLRAQPRGQARFALPGRRYPCRLGLVHG